VSCEIQHAADRRGLFETAGDVDRVAHHRQFARRTDGAVKCRPGVDPGHEVARRSDATDGRAARSRRTARSASVVGAVDAPPSQVAHVLVGVAVVVGDDAVGRRHEARS
jgi:hypothetical protein